MKSSTKQSIPNPDNNVKNNTTISHDEYQNITHQVYYTSVSSNPRYKPKIRKKTGQNSIPTMLNISDEYHLYSLNVLRNISIPHRIEITM